MTQPSASPLVRGRGSHLARDLGSDVPRLTVGPTVRPGTRCALGAAAGIAGQLAPSPVNAIEPNGR